MNHYTAFYSLAFVLGRKSKINLDTECERKQIEEAINWLASQDMDKINAVLSAISTMVHSERLYKNAMDNLFKETTDE